MLKENNVLPGDYIAGFVDGEGCFALTYRKNIRHERKNKPVYYMWKAQFVIAVRSDDIDLMNLIKNTLKCGQITLANTGKIARYSVQDTNDLNELIIPFFNKYPLHGKKVADFSLWTQAVTIIHRSKRKKVNAQKGIQGFIKTEWDPEDINKLTSICNQMKILKGISM